MFCGKCGSQISDDALFCPNCGNKIAQPEPEILVQEEAPAYEAPVQEEAPAYETPVQEEAPAYEAPVQEEATIYQAQPQVATIKTKTKKKVGPGQIIISIVLVIVMLLDLSLLATNVVLNQMSSKEAVDDVVDSIEMAEIDIRDLLDLENCRYVSEYLYYYFSLANIPGDYQNWSDKEVRKSLDNKAFKKFVKKTANEYVEAMLHDGKKAKVDVEELADVLCEVYGLDLRKAEYELDYTYSESELKDFIVSNLEEIGFDEFATNKIADGDAEVVYGIFDILLSKGMLIGEIIVLLGCVVGLAFMRFRGKWLLIAIPLYLFALPLLISPFVLKITLPNISEISGLSSLIKAVFSQLQIAGLKVGLPALIGAIAFTVVFVMSKVMKKKKENQ